VAEVDQKPGRDANRRIGVAARAFSMNSTSKPAECNSLAGVRLRRHADYVHAYAVSHKYQSASMSWFLAPQTQCAASAARVGFTVGKVLGKAHERNRIKRRMREALRRHVNLLPAGCDLIFHPRRSVLTMEFAKLEAEIVRILEQAAREAAVAAPRLARQPAACKAPSAS
jgi:ribonuclease P protein component